MLVKKLTPVVVVDAIEPCLEFWVGRLGFQQTVEVPHGDGLGFVILAHGPVELMYQTRASIAADMPAFADEPLVGHTPLFIEVDDIEAVQRALEGADVLVPERTTFYGSRETLVRGPAGQLVSFAQFPEAAEPADDA